MHVWPCIVPIIFGVQNFSTKYANLGYPTSLTKMWKNHVDAPTRGATSSSSVIGRPPHRSPSAMTPIQRWPRPCCALPFVPPPQSHFQPGRPPLRRYLLAPIWLLIASWPSIVAGLTSSSVRTPIGGHARPTHVPLPLHRDPRRRSSNVLSQFLPQPKFWL
jgi:hypothetical protein